MIAKDFYCCLGFILVLAYSAISNKWPSSFDRHNNKNPDFFWSFVLCMLVAGVVTITPSKRTGVLNRDQTNEWKGWMQIIFLLYHYYRASWVHNEVRVLVSCFIWMTGFGNFFYFYKKKDFSLARVISTLIKLNLLTLGLMVVNRTNMMMYYIVPLHTGFFLYTWITCCAVNKFQYEKIILFSSLSVLVFVFEFWRPFSDEIQFVFGLDRYGAWWGMMFAYIIMKYQKHVEWFHIAGMGLTLCCIWYIGWGYESDKYIYNVYHPYIQIVPILGYILLRNCHPILRKHHSQALSWFGGITLETYVLQFHILMCENVKNILVFVPGFPLLNSCLVAVMFVCVSYIAHEITLYVQRRVISQLKHKREYLPLEHHDSTASKVVKKDLNPT